MRVSTRSRPPTSRPAPTPRPPPRPGPSPPRRRKPPRPPPTSPIRRRPRPPRRPRRWLICSAGSRPPAGASRESGMTLPRRRGATMLVPTTLMNLHPGDRAVIDDGNYSHAAGQEIIVCDRSTASEVHPPPGENRWPVLVPESGRILLLVASTPVLVND